MKTTMIFTAEGDTYLSVAYKPGEVTQRTVRPESTLFFAEVGGSEETGFSVKFHLPFFKRFNRDGFISKQSALNYEQDIFDEHFDAYVADDPAELSETGIA